MPEMKQYLLFTEKLCVKHTAKKRKLQEAAKLFTNSFYLSVTPMAPSRSTIVSIQPCTSAFESVLSTEENVKRSVMLFTAPV